MIMVMLMMIMTSKGTLLEVSQSLHYPFTFFNLVIADSSTTDMDTLELAFI